MVLVKLDGMLLACNGIHSETASCTGSQQLYVQTSVYYVYIIALSKYIPAAAVAPALSAKKAKLRGPERGLGARRGLRFAVVSRNLYC